MVVKILSFSRQKLFFCAAFLIILFFIMTISGLYSQLPLTKTKLEEVLHTLVPILKKEEGLRLCPYKDSAGVLTIGYGHVVREEDSWMLNCLSEKQADNLLERDIISGFMSLQDLDFRYIKLPARVIAGFLRFQFNIGSHAFRSSTVHKVFAKYFLHAEDFGLYIKTPALNNKDSRQVQYLKSECHAGVLARDVCNQLKVYNRKQELKSAFLLWTKITLEGQKISLKGLSTRRLAELSMILDQPVAFK